MTIAELLCDMEDYWTLVVQKRHGGLLWELEHRDGRAMHGHVNPPVLSDFSSDVLDLALAHQLRTAIEEAGSARCPLVDDGQSDDSG